MSQEFRLIYRQHAVKRMHERCITEEDIELAIAKGTVIEDYPNDTPYPSVLLLGFVRAKVIHVVYATDITEGIRIIITAYEPDPKIWNDNFTTRR